MEMIKDAVFWILNIDIGSYENACRICYEDEENEHKSVQIFIALYNIFHLQIPIIYTVVNFNTY